MYGIIVALFIVFTMIFFIILKSCTSGAVIFHCKKSELDSILYDLPDDCVIQVLIGGKSYEHKRTRNY